MIRPDLTKAMALLRGKLASYILVHSREGSLIESTPTSEFKRYTVELSRWQLWPT